MYKFVNDRCDHIQTKENENACWLGLTLVRTIWSENPMTEPSVNPMPLDRIPLQRQSSKHWPYLAFPILMTHCCIANVISHSRPGGHP